MDVSEYIKDNPLVPYKEGAKYCNVTYDAYEKRYRRVHGGGIGKMTEKMKIPDDERWTLLEQECKNAGINLEDVKHYWFKSEHFSVFAKNKVKSYEEIRDELITDLQRYSPKFPKIKRNKIDGGHLLVISPADVHIGKLSLQEETGQSYNIEIAKKRCLEGVEGIIHKTQGFPIEQIVLVIGNDIIHTDNPFRKSTAGTPQDTDGMWWQMFKEAKNLYIQIIESLVPIADVHIIFNPSNHDYMTGFMLADTIHSWFRNCPNVSFDISIAHRKYHKYGRNLICTSHGDGAKESDMPILMASERKDLWADTDYRYIYLHHIHHKKQIKWQSGKDYHGATVEYLRTPSSSDGWHDRNGYTAVPKAIEGFIHHKTQGQIARITHYF